MKTKTKTNVRLTPVALLAIAGFGVSSLISTASATNSTDTPFTTANTVVADDNSVDTVTTSCVLDGSNTDEVDCTYAITRGCYADIDAASADMTTTEENDGDITLSGLEADFSGHSNSTAAVMTFEVDADSGAGDHDELYAALTNAETLGDLDGESLQLAGLGIGDTTQGDTLTSLQSLVLTAGSENFNWVVQFDQQDPIENIQAAAGSAADVILTTTIICDGS